MNHRLKAARREAWRLVTQYRTAIATEAHGRASQLLPAALNIALARLKYGIGPRHFSLFRLSQVPRSAWGDYITDDPAHKQRVGSLSPASVRQVAIDKALFHEHCRRHGLPTIPILAVVSAHETAAYPSVPRVTDRDQWLQRLGDVEDDLFVKPVDGTYGEGAFCVERSENGVRFLGRDGNLGDVFEHLERQLGRERAFIVQPRLRNHAAMRPYTSPHCLSTVRLVTVMDGDSPRLLYAAFKMSVGRNSSDNFHAGSVGNLLCRVDPESGALGPVWGSRRKDWPDLAEVGIHPDTGESLAGRVLPMWEAVVELTLRAQASLAQMKTVGWDVTITDGGPVLVEANSMYAMDIIQVAAGRGLKRPLYAALGLPDFFTVPVEPPTPGHPDPI